MKVRIGLDSKVYKKKPENKKEFNYIGSRAIRNEQVMDIEELADLVGNKSHAFTPAVFKRMYFFGNENKKKRQKIYFREMQVFGLDFDDGISFDEVKKRAKKYRLNFAFAYHTLSSSKELEKFRVVFVHDGIVKDVNVAEMIIGMLMDIFPECDGNCSDATRIFLGGKDVFYEDYDAVFNIEDLAMEYENYLYDTDPKHKAEKIRSLARKYKADSSDNHLHIKSVSEKERENNIEKNRDNLPESIIYIESGKKSRFYEIKMCLKKEKTSDKEKTYKGKKKKGYHKDYRDIDLNDPEIPCQLYQDFRNDIWLKHESNFLILTNLLQIEGGYSFFMKHIEANYTEEYPKKWNNQWNYCVSNEYHAQRCTNATCPYYGKSCSGSLMLERITGRIVPIDNGMKYVSLADAENALSESLQNALSMTENGMYLIQAQTGIGKTRQYIELVSKMDSPCMIAVPTNILKHEVFRKLQNISRMGVVESPSFEECGFPQEVVEEVQNAYDRGCVNDVRALWERYRKLWEHSKDPQDKKYLASYKEYSNFTKAYVRTRTHHIVTTHARLLNMCEEDISGYCVLIDEDILLSCLKSGTSSISVKELEKVRKDMPDDFKIEVDRILDTVKKGKYGRIDKTYQIQGWNLAKLKRFGISGDLNGLFHARSYCVVEGESDRIVFFAPRKFHAGKYIILSATLNPALYNDYFPDHHIQVFKTVQAEYQGKLIQYTRFSLSEGDMERKEEQFFKMLEEQFPRNIPIISFKGKERNSYRIHFGNSEGVNFFTGKDLIIAGTFHYPDYVYKLIAKALYPECDCSEKIHKVKMCRNGFRFRFMSFDEPDIQEIEYYLINSELEQCLGRARLLRHDCTVYLFSNFPCVQAEIIQENYLQPEYWENLREAVPA